MCFDFRDEALNAAAISGGKNVKTSENYRALDFHDTQQYLVKKSEQRG